MFKADDEQCARNLGCQNHSSVREALLKDDEEITSLLRTIVTSPAYRNVVLSLRGDTAEKFLTVAYRVRLGISLESVSIDEHSCIDSRARGSNSQR